MNNLLMFNPVRFKILHKFMDKYHTEVVY